MAKTISGYCKVLNGRLRTEDAVRGTEFQIKVRQAVAGDAADLVQVALLELQLAHLYVSQTDMSGELVSSAQAKPNALTTGALGTIERIIGADDKYNYLRSKCLAAQGKVALIEKRVDQAEELFKRAQWDVTASFGDVHPLAVKFN